MSLRRDPSDGPGTVLKSNFAVSVDVSLCSEKLLPSREAAASLEPKK